MARMIAERGDALPGLAEVFREYGYASQPVADRHRDRAWTGKPVSLLSRRQAGDGRRRAGRCRGLVRCCDLHAAGAGRGPALGHRCDDGRGRPLFCIRPARLPDRGLGLGATRDPFAEPIAAYFRRWIAALQTLLVRGGVAEDHAATLAQDVVSGIQGAVVLARALNDPSLFRATLGRLTARLYTALAAA